MGQRQVEHGWQACPSVELDGKHHLTAASSFPAYIALKCLAFDASEYQQSWQGLCRPKGHQYAHVCQEGCVCMHAKKTSVSVVDCRGILGSLRRAFLFCKETQLCASGGHGMLPQACKSTVQHTKPGLCFAFRGCCIPCYCVALFIAYHRVHVTG